MRYRSDPKVNAICKGSPIFLRWNSHSFAFQKKNNPSVTIATSPCFKVWQKEVSMVPWLSVALHGMNSWTTPTNFIHAGITAFLFQIIGLPRKTPKIQKILTIRHNQKSKQIKQKMHFFYPYFDGIFHNFQVRLTMNGWSSGLVPRQFIFVLKWFFLLLQRINYFPHHPRSHVV